MTDILFGNNNRPVLKLLAKRSLKAQKNTIAVLAIMLATLLFTSLSTIALSLQTAMQESNIRTIGTSAHAGIKRVSWDEYEQLAADTRVKDIGYSVIVGNAVGERFHKTPTELRYGDAAYADMTFNVPDTGRLPEQKNEIATSRIVLAAMGLPDEIGTQMELTFVTDTDTFTDTFTLCGIWDGDAMPTEWDIEKQALEVTSKYGLDERVSINDAYGTFINSMTTSILSRHKEIAMLQSVGMTGRQVKQMLIYEGIGYSALGLLCSLILSIAGSLTVVRMMGQN